MTARAAADPWRGHLDRRTALPAVPRAFYAGGEPRSYGTLNPDLPPAQLPAAMEMARRVPKRWTREAFHELAGRDGLDSLVKVLPLPLRIPPEVRAAALAEMWGLREDGLLTALRGDRKTDLARPVSRETAARIAARCPHLRQVVERVEGALQGGPLFLRALKIDAARASSTSPEAERLAPNLHFDAPRSSVRDFPDPVWQFYLNLGTEVRQFLILPVHRDEMILRIAEKTGLEAGALASIHLIRVLDLFMGLFRVPLEVIPVPPLSLAAFDGRVFPHDAAKLDPRRLRAGRLALAGEPDFVAALDLRQAGYHQGYDPEAGFLAG